ncbi:hypothetical protein [Candidatus Nanosyncoccus alces]|uniref:PASTA domain-containing protein n=1 Tax=Candidatus Nanosyncoccus alces TaxID=2171997 RepID=A0ABY0FL72_9BACT|nr:hypothetical protein [Candidatus Nanosyncoccus alces]RYC74420.1 hypothetical protein G3RUM_00574 [Candidatus Nanosyncoccus alces]
MKSIPKKSGPSAHKSIKQLALNKRFAVGGIVGFLIILFVAIAYFANKPVATRDDFTGLTINQAISLAEEKGILYDIYQNGYYDKNAQDEQTVTFVSTVYKANGEIDYDYNRYTSNGYGLHKGDKISFETTHITSNQQKNIDACKQLGDDYIYQFKDGGVACEKKEPQKEETEEEKAWREAHGACKKYGANAYAKTLDSCYVGNEYKGSVSGQDDEKTNTEATEENEPTSASTSNQSSDKPSIDTIADACWAYGQKTGVHLTDYASTNIVQEGNYYQILMWNKDKSVWKCWYNPSDGDVFIEKTKDNR